jgi:hypothetical protein
MNNSQKTPFSKSLSNFTSRRIGDALQLLGKAWPCSVVAVNGAIVTVAFEVVPPNGPNGPLTIPQVTCPIAESTYVQLPIQVGDFGFTVPADTRLGGVSGLGTGLADISLPGNLGGLVFVPIGNSSWVSPNVNAVYINGPDGVIIQNTAGDSKITVTPTEIVLTRGDTTVTLNNTSATIDVSGDTVVVNGSSITSTVSGNTTVVNASSITSTVGSASIALNATTATITATNIILNGSITFNGTVTGTANFGTIVASGDVTAGGVSLESHIHSGVTSGSSDTGPPV